MVELMREPRMPAKCWDDSVVPFRLRPQVATAADGKLVGDIGYEVLVLGASGHDSYGPGFHAANPSYGGHRVGGMTVRVIHADVPREGVLGRWLRTWFGIVRAFGLASWRTHVCEVVSFLPFRGVIRMFQ